MAFVADFEFDPYKAAINFEEHGIVFEEAMTVFSDPLSSTLPDDQHSIDENRYLTVGLSSRNRLLFLVYTERLPNPTHPGTARNCDERKQYEEGT